LDGIYNEGQGGSTINHPVLPPILKERGDNVRFFHPHPHPLPSREREIDEQGKR